MKKLFIIVLSMLLTQVAVASNFVKYNKLASPPPTAEAGALYQFYDSSGVLKTINQSGTVAPVIGNIDLTSQVTGILPKANGGTGVSSTAIFPTSGTVTYQAAGSSTNNGIAVFNGSSGDTLVSSSVTLPSGGGMVFPIGGSIKFLSGTYVSKALATTALGTITPSATTAAELGFLSGVTSNVQTQLNNVTTRTYPNSTTATSATCSVTCGTGTITGGGCRNSSGSVANVSSYASSSTVWSCTYLTAVGDCTAYAICM